MRRQWLVVISVVLLAFILRLPLLSGSFWMDEAAQALESARPLAEQLNIAYDFQPPLLHLLLFLPIRLSLSEWWLRLWGALLPGIGTVICTYLIGKKVTDHRGGLIAAGLLATSSFHIFFSQELRPYSLPTFFALLSWLFLINATTGPKSPKSNWIGYTLSTIAGLYSSYLYPFLLIGQAIFIVWQHKKQFQTWLTTALISSLAWLPWLPSFLEQLKVGQNVRVELPGWETVVSTPQLKSIALVGGKFIFGVVNIEPNAFYLALSGLLLGTLGLTVYKTRSFFLTKKHLTSTALLVCWLIVPLLTAWLVSFVVPVVSPKRVMFALPALYIFISYLGLLLPKPFHNKKQAWLTIGNILVAILLFLNISGTWQYYTNSQYQRENWRSLHEHIVEKYPADRSVAVFIFPEPFAPWLWYDGGAYPTIVTGTLHISDVEDVAQKLKSITDYEYVLLFDYLSDLTDPQKEVQKQLEAFGYQQRTVIDYPQIGFVRVFTRYQPVASTKSL